MLMGVCVGVNARPGDGGFGFPRAKTSTSSMSCHELAL